MVLLQPIGDVAAQLKRGMASLHAPLAHQQQMLRAQSRPDKPPLKMTRKHKAALVLALAFVTVCVGFLLESLPATSKCDVSSIPHVLADSAFTLTTYIASTTATCITACSLHHFPTSSGHMAAARPGDTGQWPASFFKGLGNGVKLCCTGW